MQPWLRGLQRGPERHGGIGFSKDFPYINAMAACIKCGDGWMPGYWHRRARRQLPGMPRHFDLLAGKLMCGHCRNKYSLGLYYSPEYKPYVTEAEVERVRLESRADYIGPAKTAAVCQQILRAGPDCVKSPISLESQKKSLGSSCSSRMFGLLSALWGGGLTVLWHHFHGWGHKCNHGRCEKPKPKKKPMPRMGDGVHLCVASRINL